MTIPKIFHLTWKTRQLPTTYQKNFNAWQELHPDYEFKIYDDNDIKDFIFEHYPEFSSLYMSFPKHIMRVDFVRYAILHKYGGIYVDCDTYPLKSFDKLLDNNQILLAPECPEHSAKLQLCNAIMLSPKNMQFWYHFMEYIADNYVSTQQSNVVMATGPIALTDFYNSTLTKSTTSSKRSLTKLSQLQSSQAKVKVLAFDTFYPLTDPKLKKKSQSIIIQFPTRLEEFKSKHVSATANLNNSYAVHTWDHDWLISNNYNIAVYILIAILVILIILIIIYAFRN